MAQYLTPGVYVEEVSSGARPIEAVGTSVAAIIGRAPNPQGPSAAPRALTSYSAFARQFVDGAAGPSVLATAVAGFFTNGGGLCYVLDPGAEADHTLGPQSLAPLDAIDGINLVAAPGYTDAASTEAVMAHCEARGDRFAILDAPADVPSLDQLTRANNEEGGLRPRQSERGLAAVYTPWIYTPDILTGETVAQPPSGHLAGVYSRIDTERGVYKAPANTVLRGATGLTRAILGSEQAMLNPAGVNVIRSFADGIRVWGARTLADPASDWRYVPVRRLVTMIAQSIERGTRWVVFEPNDLSLWKSIRRDVGAFLNTLWREGALAGATPEQAFFVKCDSETTTQEDIDAGRVIALIGIAPVRPAEFVILRIGQSTQQSTTEAV